MYFRLMIALAVALFLSFSAHAASVTVFQSGGCWYIDKESQQRKNGFCVQFANAGKMYMSAYTLQGSLQGAVEIQPDGSWEYVTLTEEVNQQLVTGVLEYQLARTR